MNDTSIYDSIGKDEEEHIPYSYNRPIMRVIYRYIVLEHGNMIIGITGRVRKGKSHTGVHIIRSWNRKITLDSCLVYTVEELMEKTLSYIWVDGRPLTTEEYKHIDDFKRWLMENSDKIHLKTGRAILFDEAGAGVFVRDFFSQDNKTLSKIIQLWGILRMLVVVVVPENMGMAEKNLRVFMDIEVKMIRVNRRLGEAYAVAYEFLDKSNPDWPIKRRVAGCREGGLIHVKKLPDDVSKEYEKVSKVMKITAMYNLYKNIIPDIKIGENARPKLDRFKDLFEENIDKCYNKKGRLDLELIQLNVNCSAAMARLLRAYAADRVERHKKENKDEDEEYLEENEDLGNKSIDYIYKF